MAEDGKGFFTFVWGSTTIPEEWALAMEERGEAHVSYGDSSGLIIMKPGPARGWSGGTHEQKGK